ncbi:MAG: carboxypeptidase-like regulatory domain-containing protein [Planctomycetota bacterium]
MKLIPVLSGSLFFLGGLLLVLPRGAGADEPLPVVPRIPVPQGGMEAGTAQPTPDHGGDVRAEADRPTLLEPGRVRGRVLWEKRREEIAGIQVRVFERHGGQPLRQAPATLDELGKQLRLIGTGASDDRGWFEIELGKSRGELYLAVGAGAGTVGLFAITEGPAMGELLELGELLLEDCGEATGRVLDGHGDPVANAWVRVHPLDGEEPLDFEPDGLILVPEPEPRVLTMTEELRNELHRDGPGRARTDEDGRFRLDELPSGSSRLRIHADRHLPFEQELEVKAGKAQELGEIALDPGRAVSGQVVDQNGEPVAEVRICAGTSDRDVGLSGLRAKVLSRPVMTDAEGRFEFGGLGHGDLYVAVRPAGAFDWQVLGPLPATDALRIQLDLPYVQTPEVTGPGGDGRRGF